MRRPTGLKLAAVALAAAAALAPIAGFAQSTSEDLSDSGDTAWLLTSAALVMLLALPGLVLFFAGRARRNSALSVAAQVGAIVSAVSLVWIVTGYTLAFGRVTTGWIGAGNAWMLIDLASLRDGTTVSESAFALQQMMLAALAAALLAGAWAGRARFGWAIAFAAVWSVAVYAPIAHWVWGGGWLARAMGTRDFGGGLVIETSAGVSALVAALLLGSRSAAAHGEAQSQV